MNINIISFGTNMPHWINEGYQNFLNRLPKSIKVTLKEIPVERKTLQNLEAYETAILKKLTATSDHLIALASHGLEKNSFDFARVLNHWQIASTQIVFIIGGPTGLSNKTLDLAHEIWSLSRLTFPHMLTRLILIEQIYRANCKNTNHPYFK